MTHDQMETVLNTAFAKVTARAEQEQDALSLARSEREEAQADLLRSMMSGETQYIKAARERMREATHKVMREELKCRRGA
jgi:hypothetical protein